MRFDCQATLGLLLGLGCGYDWTVVPDGASQSAAKGSFACGTIRCSADEFCIELEEKKSRDYRCIPFLCTDRDCSCKDVAAKCPGSCEEVAGGGTLARCSAE